MSRGKIILQDVINPVERMKVYWINDDNVPKRIWTIDHIDKYGISLAWVHDQYVQLPELKQLAVEYLEEIAINRHTLQKTYKDSILPLHPDDYERAVRLIGQEVEFDIIPSSYSTVKENSSKVVHHDTSKAKLSLSTPVNNSDWEGKFDQWWSAGATGEPVNLYSTKQWIKKNILPTPEERKKILAEMMENDQKFGLYDTSEETWDDIKKAYKKQRNRGMLTDEELSLFEFLEDYLPPKRK